MNPPVMPPFWSVMIPTYRPSAEYLKQALAGVLQQDPGPAEMQIAVVDDASPDVDVAALVRAIAGERVTVARAPKNLGLAGCWNACIAHAQGEWVHLLHQDDLVFPGFYATLRDLVRAFPSAGAAFCRHCVVDEQSAWGDLSPIESHRPALLEDFQFKLTCGQRIRCPAIVVRRSVYGSLGGFRGNLPYCLDWEMWTRIAAAHPFAHSPAILAGYRCHASSETARLDASTATFADERRTFDELLLRLPKERRAAAREAFTGWFGPRLVRQTQASYARRNYVLVRQLIECGLDLPLPPAEMRELRRVARNSQLKQMLLPRRTARA